MHYHVIGTDHKLQKASCADTGLRGKLQLAVRDYSVVLVAEEVKADEDVLTFGRELVGDEKWLSVGMTDQQRKDAGIYETLRKDHAPEFNPTTGAFQRVNAYFLQAETKRENHWLDRIEEWCRNRGRLEGSVVITCGINHVEFLSQKAKDRGHAVTTDEYIPYDHEATWGVLRLIDEAED